MRRGWRRLLRPIEWLLGIRVGRDYRIEPLDVALVAMVLAAFFSLGVGVAACVARLIP